LRIHTLSPGSDGSTYPAEEGPPPVQWTLICSITSPDNGRCGILGKPAADVGDPHLL